MMMKIKIKFKSENLKTLSVYDSITKLNFMWKRKQRNQKYYEKIIRYKNKILLNELIYRKE